MVCHKVHALFDLIFLQLDIWIYKVGCGDKLLIKLQPPNKSNMMFFEVLMI